MFLKKSLGRNTASLERAENSTKWKEAFEPSGFYKQEAGCETTQQQTGATFHEERRMTQRIDPRVQRVDPRDLVTHPRPQS